MSSAATLHWAAQTHSGSRKPRNDDSWIAFASGPEGAATLEEAGSISLHRHDLVFAVSDGMGGGNAGDLASSLLLRKMSEIIPETFKIAASGFDPDCLEHLGEAIRSVHEHINETADSEHTRGMAATLALAWFTPENLYIANAGDSRVYLSRGGRTEQLTRDHTAAFGQWKRGEINEFQYRSHPRRSALYEVIGGGHAQICPHFATAPYQHDDRILICSDGLIDGLWERHISEALAEDAPPAEICSHLLKRAIDNSGIDDTTLVVVRIHQPEDHQEAVS
ncbi:MAG: serine/threonine-protein phosphatase [Verrucomicrobiae bacterium]|nr:serine/threonine-protein phosphatase [Verrucomicrobiae bacterium]MCP5534267.1 serine/threonine-protein phosphatase [Akkermansiaceae bacterium]MCP5543067.1 serine/threonine-protein phosphatase [Akkermansiaceae bacterium]